MIRNLAENIFTTTIPVQPLNNENLEKAKILFDTYKKDNVIKNGNFDFDIWQVTDEKSNYSLRFEVNYFSYKAYYFSMLNINADIFIGYAKVFSLYCFGKYSLRAIQLFLNDIRKILNIQSSNLDYNLKIL